MLGPILGVAGNVVSGIIGSSAAKKAAREAAAQKRALQQKLKSLEDNRQEIINPYAGYQNLSSSISNPFANLGVATQAAEMQAEGADISLANTLDTLRATGASAGGATALAQAALRSKKDISANIEQQEATNSRLKAQGEQQMQQARRAEEIRMQQAGAAGKEFVFAQTERREQQQLDRTAALLDAASGIEQQAKADQVGAITGAIGGVTDILGGIGI